MDFGEEENFDYFTVEELVMELFQGANVENVGEENMEWLMQNFPGVGGVLLLAESVGNPAIRNVVHNLPVVHLREEDVCGICLEDMLVNEVVKQLPCCHHFHGQCIDPWLEMHNTCPICNTSCLNSRWIIRELLNY